MGLEDNNVVESGEIYIYIYIYILVLQSNPTIRVSV